MSNAPTVCDIDVYRDTPNKSHVLNWISKVEKRHKRSLAKFSACLRLLAKHGRHLNKAQAKRTQLDSHIYELRPTYEGNAYRILYFFHGNSAVLCDAMLKKKDSEFNKAVNRSAKKRKKYLDSPSAYSSANWQPYLSFREKFIGQ